MPAYRGFSTFSSFPVFAALCMCVLSLTGCLLLLRIGLKFVLIIQKRLFTTRNDLNSSSTRFTAIKWIKRNHFWPEHRILDFLEWISNWVFAKKIFILCGINTILLHPEVVPPWIPTTVVALKLKNSPLRYFACMFDKRTV